MQRIVYLPFFIFIFSGFLPVHIHAVPSSNLESTSFTFFSTDIILKYPTAFKSPTLRTVSESEIARFYKRLKATNYDHLIRDIRYFKNTLGLTDWLLYKLVYQAIDHIFQHKSNAEKELGSWFLLSELGFDTRITYINKSIFVCVYANEELYEIPLIQDGSRTFANLTSYRKGMAAQSKELFLLNYKPKTNGSSFNFLLKNHPGLPQQKKSRSVSFSFKNNEYLFEVTYDQNLVRVMEDYPYFSEQQYLEIPLSDIAYNSLIPKFKHLIEGKTQKEALELLATFTRSAFDYKEDKFYFGKSKPMIAEEVLYYPFSDCEDRSALFFQLVKVLLDLPMIAIAYDDHLTIGVASEELFGEYLLYQGRKYHICDPTGPYDSSKIGRFPEGYKEKSYKIITAYK